MFTGKRFWLFPLLLIGAVFVFAACPAEEEAPPPPAPPEELAGEMEIFSWWTTGGEEAALFSLYDLYATECSPDVEIINAVVAGGAGFEAKPVLKTRMLGGDPPDSFQVHMGRELIDTWVTTGYMEPLDWLFQEEGWNEIMPPGVLEIISWEGKPYSVPVNIHRANILWYNKQIFEEHNLEPPATFDEFFQVAETLKAADIIPLALGDLGIWATVHLLETVLLGTLGPELYKGLWTGATDFNIPEVTQALETFNRMLDYVNPDHAALHWDGANQLVIDGKAAMHIMGDWVHGDYVAKGWEGFGWAPPPGTDGTYQALSDTFGLPKDVPNRDAVVCWLRVVGSKAGQEAFNPLKGSVCARLDCDPALFPPYLQSAIQDWKVDTIVPSLAHGAAVSDPWTLLINDAVSAFMADRDVATLQSRLAQSCVDAGVCPA